jgi:hypothetical protein
MVFGSRGGKIEGGKPVEHATGQSGILTKWPDPNLFTPITRIIYAIFSHSGAPDLSMRRSP